MLKGLCHQGNEYWGALPASGADAHDGQGRDNDVSGNCSGADRGGRGDHYCDGFGQNRGYGLESATPLDSES